MSKLINSVFDISNYFLNSSSLSFAKSLGTTWLIALGLTWLGLAYHVTSQLHSTELKFWSRFKSCYQRVWDLRWWESLTVIPAWNKTLRLSLVNHTTESNHHHYCHLIALKAFVTSVHQGKSSCCQTIFKIVISK